MAGMAMAIRTFVKSDCGIMHSAVCMSYVYLMQVWCM